jgi:hypothetical protein
VLTDRQSFVRPGVREDRYLWDELLTEQDQAWLAGHMRIIHDMNHWLSPRDPYEPGLRA